MTRTGSRAAALGSALLACLLAAPVGGEGAITGRADVIDGDTVAIGAVRVRLLGIDTPEPDQICVAPGVTIACGARATEALRQLLEPVGYLIACEPRYAQDDPYGRILAECWPGPETRRGPSLSRSLAADGWAVPWGSLYEDAALQARAQGLGIWSMGFVVPCSYRAKQRGRMDRYAGCMPNWKYWADLTTNPYAEP